ncbi:MAG TPA: DNA repair protein RecO [Candidatus Binatia bacterium]|nr:DNA repair protein RecO [Candidatus Binatia bacterium]
MRSSHATPAIVLRSWPYGESDKIVSFITENHGKLVGIAKGAKRSRKRFPNSLEPFSLVNLRFQDRPHGGLVFILSSDLMRGFKHLVTSLEKIAFASYLVEITDGLIAEREENRLVFQHLRDGLNYLEENGTSLTFLAYFELKLLRLTGYQPGLSSCKRCGRDHGDKLVFQWHFSLRDGGVLCESCSRSRKEIMPLSAATLEVLMEFQESTTAPGSTRSLPSSLVKEIRSVILRFIQFHMEKEIKSASFIQQFSSV